MKIWSALWIVLIMIPVTVSAREEHHRPDFGDVLQEIVTRHDVDLVRDSGATVTRAFLDSCRKDLGPNHVVLECADLNFPWHISQIPNTGERDLFLISEDGASVENRWVLEYEAGRFRDVTAAGWPDISIATVSERTIAATGDHKYTETYLEQVAHSPYRIEHPTTATDPITVHTGVPDQTYGTKIGELRWNGTSLELH
ncbi:MAG TPA: hypothetical protein VMS55_14190 [Myxococcota bacterium]|nr:hypothetical protein [Myxococcota bacterium]